MTDYVRDDKTGLYLPHEEQERQGQSTVARLFSESMESGYQRMMRDRVRVEQGFTQLDWGLDVTETWLFSVIPLSRLPLGMRR